ncbi:hypothetical protein C8F04DRAFT_1144300 [Mycena alexandri]|uniref:Uncharacterized protein n=1 Tax=Mycena alexandri TaxID=1745969 RepID=A0AAD6WPL2_9AGAR|nr:hypothetical protein C8F04DRAFT_1144300 [Mycena alexandri]
MPGASGRGACHVASFLPLPTFAASTLILLPIHFMVPRLSPALYLYRRRHSLRNPIGHCYSDGIAPSASTSTATPLPAPGVPLSGFPTRCSRCYLKTVPLTSRVSHPIGSRRP